jgi:hypothetical protein
MRALGGGSEQIARWSAFPQRRCHQGLDSQRKRLERQRRRRGDGGRGGNPRHFPPHPFSPLCARPTLSPTLAKFRQPLSFARVVHKADSTRTRVLPASSRTTCHDRDSLRRLRAASALAVTAAYAEFAHRRISYSWSRHRKRQRQGLHLSHHSLVLTLPDTLERMGAHVKQQLSLDVRRVLHGAPA